jgi:hypothetical protein
MDGFARKFDALGEKVSWISSGLFIFSVQASAGRNVAAYARDRSTRDTKEGSIGLIVDAS